MLKILNTRLPPALLFAIWPLAGVAQNYEIGSHVVSGGGGNASGGDYSLSGTIGQPAAGAASGGDYTLRGGFWGRTLEVIVEPDESFEAWMDSLPPEHQPPAEQRGPHDVAAGDGMTNLLKYALGLMPMTPAAGAAPRVAADDDYLGIELERSTDAAVSFQIKGSSDLNEWVDVAHVEELIDSDAGDNRERVQLLTGLATDEHPRYFIRLHVKME